MNKYPKFGKPVSQSILNLCRPFYFILLAGLLMSLTLISPLKTNTARYQLIKAKAKNKKSEGTFTPIFTIVEEMPHFPGGDVGWKDFLSKNLKYPLLAKKEGIQGKVWIDIWVDQFGNIRDAQVIRGIGG